MDEIHILRGKERKYLSNFPLDPAIMAKSNVIHFNNQNFLALQIFVFKEFKRILRIKLFVIIIPNNAPLYSDTCVRYFKC